MGTAAEGGLDQLATGGVPTASATAQLLRPHPEAESWRLDEVLLAYPTGDGEAQALVRDLLHAMANGHLPGLPAHHERYVQAPATYTGNDLTVSTAGGVTSTRNWQLRAALQLLVTCPTTVLNPRRENFLMHDPVAAVQSPARLVRVPTNGSTGVGPHSECPVPVW
ncbi:hypothetical protein [Streptomyces sp. x-19]|uniref:hypothetical protein n=1 Tax=Streptomyces sp. x-19 TaxID=2789280 RepID=UPI003980E24E